VRLPLAGLEGSLRPRVRTRDMEPLVIDAQPRQLRIVLVDDNEDARELVAHMLESAGHTVQLAHDGPSGLEAILESRPDAALIDIGLPGMTGLDVARALRERCPDLPTRLVAFTGYCGADSIARATEAGFEDHLVKPATLEAVLKCLGDGQPMRQR
jgi:CheY-like chemotaxis protein